MHDMTTREAVDVAVVLTESGLHAEHVVVLAREGKHITVEKPMSLTLGDVDLEDMLRAVAAAVIAGVSG